jgi:hypothetical protein
MANLQDANKQGEADGLETGTQNKISSTPTTSEKDALGDSSLNDVSGGAWPNATTKSGTTAPTI